MSNPVSACRGAASAALLLASLATAVAQVTPPKPLPPSPPAEDAIVLSPFTVSTEKDNGYAATETLAGTRLRTELRHPRNFKLSVTFDL